MRPAEHPRRPVAGQSLETAAIPLPFAARIVSRKRRVRLTYLLHFRDEERKAGNAPDGRLILKVGALHFVLQMHEGDG